MKSIYIINPKSDPVAYFSVDIFNGTGFEAMTSIADLVLPTLAALVPEGLTVTLCDEAVQTVDLDTSADFIALTGKSSQTRRMFDLARAFRSRGKTVLIGGPTATLDPERVRPHCDILVQGEIEEIAGGLFQDLIAGTWKDSYAGTRPDLSKSPVPRWDLYPNNRALNGTVQTSRGCPFTCDFCEVPWFVGRKQRIKPPDKVIEELDVLYKLGYRSAFIADDNFTVYRRRAKELLAAIRWWNERQDDGAMSFITQVSLDAARDDELLEMCARAGIASVFIGIETPSEESLLASGKRQNLGRDLVADIQRFLDHHIVVISGLIVGFDTDGPDIFERQRRFVQSAPVPIFSLGALVATAQTPLLARLTAEGRVVTDDFSTTATPWHTNIIPKQMSREALIAGLKQLSRDIYSPEAFGDRVVALMEGLGPYTGPKKSMAMPNVRSTYARDRSTVIKRLISRGPAENRMAKRLLRKALSIDPSYLGIVNMALLQYAQVRYVYDLVDNAGPRDTAPASPDPIALPPGLRSL
jgi:hypothetical protein